MLNVFFRRRKVTATRMDAMTFMVSIDNDPSLTFTVSHMDPSVSIAADNPQFAALELAAQREVIKAIHRAGNSTRSSGAGSVALVAAVALLGLVSLASVGQLSDNQPVASQQCSFPSTQLDPASLSFNNEELEAINTQSPGLTELEALHRDLKSLVGTYEGDSAPANRVKPNRTSEYEFGY